MPRSGATHRFPRRGARRLRDEIVVGLVAGVGAPLETVQSLLRSVLEELGYEIELIRLSRLTEYFDLPTPPAPASAKEARRIDTSMTRGNEAREATGRDDILALVSIAGIRARRGPGRTQLKGQAFVLRQLKHPAEVSLLRLVYGDGFHMVGVYARKAQRQSLLRKAGVSSRDVVRLIERDEHEDSRSGQQLRDTFHLADFFVDASATRDRVRAEIQRYFGLVFARSIHGPTRDEFGMFQAHASALRSAQLGRQVGASILDRRADLLAVGTNEVAQCGGGSYWEGDEPDARDHARGRDSSDEMRAKIAGEVAVRLTPEWERMGAESRLAREREVQVALKSTIVSGLTEFGRAVHAEADALLAAARVGVSVSDCTLYCTTFPCHVCAKHIIAAGIARLVFVEPYPKSKALDLFSDSISIEAERRGRVLFEPFVGIAPRRFGDLFSMRTRDGELLVRKDASGFVGGESQRVRLEMPYWSALDREGWAADDLRKAITKGGS